MSTYRTHFCYGAKTFNLLKYFSSVDNFITLSEHCIIDLKLHGDALFSEYCAFEETFKTDKSNSQFWVHIFKIGDFSIIQNIMELLCSIPLSNTYCERIFALMGFIWTDLRNILKPENVKILKPKEKNLEIP
jgi:hypothetical protein